MPLEHGAVSSLAILVEPSEWVGAGFAFPMISRVAIGMLSSG